MHQARGVDANAHASANFFVGGGLLVDVDLDWSGGRGGGRGVAMVVNAESGEQATYAAAYYRDAEGLVFPDGHCGGAG